MNTVYDILIDYTTGDSFSSERTEDLVGIVTTDIDKAKENLKRIKEHYQRHSDALNGDWNLELLTDEGTRTISPFWTGYFEVLHGAKITTIGDSDMSFEL